MSRSFAKWKELFFDRSLILKKAEKAKYRALMRFGAYVRRVAKTSMRYRKKASPPGQPPSAHKDGRKAALKKLGRAKHNGALLREYLFYGWDRSTETVVVGPAGLAGSKVPQLHEHGGAVAAEKGDGVAVKNPAGRDPKTGRFYSRGTHWVSLAGKTLRYPKRPTMRPALDATKSKFPAQFRDSIR